MWKQWDWSRERVEILESGNYCFISRLPAGAIFAPAGKCASRVSPETRRLLDYTIQSSSLSQAGSWTSVTSVPVVLCIKLCPLRLSRQYITVVSLCTVRQARMVSIIHSFSPRRIRCIVMRTMSTATIPKRWYISLFKLWDTQPGGPGRSISGARLYEGARRAGGALGKPKPVDLRLGSCQGRVRGKSAGLHCGYQA